MMELTLELYRWTNGLLGHTFPGWTGERARRRFMTPTRRRARKALDLGAERAVLPSGVVAYTWRPSMPRGRVLAIHGWDSQARHLRVLARTLVEAGWSVTALDAPAHGESPGREANPVVFAEALREAGYVLGPFDVLVGHSMGGGAALFAVAEGLQVARVVTLAAPASVDEVLTRFSSFIGLPDPARRALRARVVSVVGRRPEEVDVGTYAGRVTIPVLVVHDAEDREVPFADAQQLVRHLPNATLLETRGLGHGWIVRDTGVARDIAAWLAGGPQSRGASPASNAT